MAATAQPRAAPRGGQREGPAERLAEFVVLAGMVVLAVASVLPLLLVALPVWGTLYALRARSWRVKGPALAVCVLPVLVALLWAYVARGTAPPDAALGYVDVQLAAAAALAGAWQGGGGVGAFDWPGYGLAVGPYALAGGAALGGLGFLWFGCFGRTEGKTAGTELPESEDVAEADAEPPVDWLVFRVVGRRVLTLVSAPPGGGKGYWTWGYLRAMQDGLDFFGLAVRRPWSSPGWLARRFGAKPRPLKVLWMTEEGPSFKTTADAFGIRPGLVARIRRDQVPTSDWPAIVRLARREARKKGCGLVIFDTIRAWCPQAERSPEEANAVMLVARQELARDGLAVQFVHHDSKAGGDFGAGVSGTYGLVGAVDVLVELRRVSDDPKDARRRMLVSRRYGDQDVVAALRDHRYVTDGRPSSPGTPGGESAPPGVPSHLQRSRTTLTSGPPRTVGELLALEGGGESALIARLKALEQLGQAERRGRGVKGDPVRWTAPAVHPEAPGAPVAVRDDPAYVAYLKSPAWAARRREALTRAGGECQRCGPGGAPGEEVHHLTYERLYDELPGDLIALCAPCHRRAHPPA